jgi:hypothetical protein
METCHEVVTRRIPTQEAHHDSRALVPKSPRIFLLGYFSPVFFQVFRKYKRGGSYIKIVRNVKFNDEGATSNLRPYRPGSKRPEAVAFARPSILRLSS